MDQPAQLAESPVSELCQQTSVNNGTLVATKQHYEVAVIVAKEEAVLELGAMEDVALLRPILCSFAISLGSFICGTVIGWPSPAVYNLNGHACNSFFLTDEQNSWVGSIAILGALIGGLIGGPCMDAIGRKTTIMIWLVLLSVGWVIIIASPNYPCVLAGRAVTGIGMGIFSVVCPIYIAEIAPIKIRGLLGSCHQMMICNGVLVTYIFGAFLDWNVLTVYCVSINVIMIIVMCFIPESPRWLVFKHKKLEAEESLSWLRGDPNYDVHPELLSLEVSVKSSADQANLKDFAKPELWKPLVVSLGLMIAQPLSGVNVIVTYVVQIFQMAGSSMDANTQSIMVGTVGVIGTLVSVFISDLTGRKVLLVTSAVLMSATMAGMGAFFYEQFLDPDYANTNLSWLPIVCMLLFCFGFNCAFGPIPWVIMGEIAPQRAKGFVSSLSMAASWLFGFIITKYFTDLGNLIGTYGAYWLCCAFCFLDIPFDIFFVPENKGKSFEEIARGFESK